jgi:hypothetical protein
MTLPGWNPRMLSRAARPYSPVERARTDLPTVGENDRYNQVWKGSDARQKIDYENDPAVQEGEAPEDGVDKSSAMRILAAASAIHTAACLLNGFGNPDEGDGLIDGAGVFQDASAILGSAGSDPGWRGGVAQTYDRRNSEQRTRADEMAALDTEFVGLLQTQAAEVTKLRWEMGGIAAALAVAFPIAWELYMTPSCGPAVSNAFQTATAIACLGADTGLQTQQGMRSRKTGAAMDAVASRYGQIAGT